MRLVLRMFLPPACVLLVAIFFPFLATAQQSAMSHFVDGVEAFELGNYDEAIRSLEKAIQLDPSNLECQYYLGLTYSAMKKYGEAIEIFESIVAREPVDFRKAYFEIAAVYAKQEKYQQAIDTLAIVERIDPKDARVYLEKGYAYQRLKDYEQAVDNFNEAKKLNPRLLQVVYYNIAAVYFEAEEFDRSLQIFNKAIEANPKTAIAENARKSIPNVRAAKKARKPWYLSASFTWGYDDNVLLQPLEQAGVVPVGAEAAEEGDEFQTLILSGGFKFVNRKDLELAIGYSLHNTGYEDLFEENNILGHIPHFYIQYNHHPYYLRVHYDFSYYYTGGDENGQDEGLFLTFGDGSDSKLRMHNVMPTISIVEPYGLRSDITLNYQNKDYLDGITPNSSLYSGAIIQSYKLPNKDIYLRAGYKHIYEDATDEEASYRYHEGLAGVSFPIYWGVRGDISFSYTRAKYQGDPRRRDTRYMSAASLTKVITDWIQLLFSYSYTHNNSKGLENGTDPFKYEKNVYALTITAIF